MSKRGATVISVFVALAIVCFLFALMLPVYREAMFTPRPEHRVRATKSVKPFLGMELASLRVIAVNNDIGMIYLTVDPLADTEQRLRGIGNASSIGPDIWQLPCEDATVLVHLKSRPMKLLHGPLQSRNLEVCKEHFLKWVQTKALPRGF